MEMLLASHSIRAFPPRICSVERKQNSNPKKKFGSILSRTEELSLFDCDGLRDVARLINVGPFQRRDVVGK